MKTEFEVFGLKLVLRAVPASLWINITTKHSNDYKQETGTKLPLISEIQFLINKKIFMFNLFGKHALLLFTKQQIIMNIKYMYITA